MSEHTQQSVTQIRDARHRIARGSRWAQEKGHVLDDVAFLLGPAAASDDVMRCDSQRSLVWCQQKPEVLGQGAKSTTRTETGLQVKAAGRDPQTDMAAAAPGSSAVGTL